MARPSKFEAIELPQGKTLREYLRDRLNSGTGKEELAAEIGVSYKAFYDKLIELKIEDRRVFFFAEEAERVAI